MVAGIAAIWEMQRIRNPGASLEDARNLWNEVRDGRKPAVILANITEEEMERAGEILRKRTIDAEFDIYYHKYRESVPL